MSTTLTNGLKLPDKGSVDWYADMQSNYAILDGAVGTIAEHTTQIAGKAPLVHTHTKSDITDLFNSANTWSALNTYSNGQIKIKSQSQEIGVIPSSGVIQYLEFADKNNAQHGIVGLWDYANGTSEIQMYISDKFKNGAKDPTGTSETTILSFGFKADGSKFLTFSGQVDNSVIPKSNNTYDLGSSSYQWNNLYANKVNTQSLNGVNPGALSLPAGFAASSIVVDITDWYIQDPDYPDDPTKKILDAVNHKVDTAVPGWLHIIFPNVSGNWAYARQYAAGVNMDLQRIADGVASSDFANVNFIFPIYSSCNVRIKAKTATVRIFPCLGNV